MLQRTIGTRTVSAIGLGGGPLSTDGRPDRSQAVATVHAALDAGVTLIDTADCYHLAGDEPGHNEELIAQALRSYGDTSHVLVATKGGQRHPADGSWVQTGRPEQLTEAARASARRLGVDAIGLYQFHCPDPAVPFADSIGALVDLLADGVIEQAGVSNVSIAQVDEARRILGDRLVSVQNQFSPSVRESLDVLRQCADAGLAFLPWSPLGGVTGAAGLGGRHAVFQQIADRHGVSPQRIALAWELALAPVVIPIPGASRPATITDSAQATTIDLTDDDLAALSASE